MPREPRIPAADADPSSLSRKERKLWYRHHARRVMNGRVCPRPSRMLKNTFGDDYVAHLIAGSIQIVIRRNERGRFRYEYAVRNGYRNPLGDRRDGSFRPREEGAVHCQGRANAVRFLDEYARVHGIGYNKIVYAVGA